MDMSGKVLKTVCKNNKKIKCMKSFFKWLLMAVIVLILPVWLWNVKYLTYIDQHGKAIAWLIAPILAMAGTLIFLGMSDANKKVTVKGKINPFWGWFGCCLVLNLLIVLLSNS